MTTPSSERANGLLYALGCYLIWGLLPLYLRMFPEVPALEYVGWRLVFTVPICLLTVVVMRQGDALRVALRDRRVVSILLASAVLIAFNWLIYTAAIQSGHVFAASLGYYINPLMNVLAGTLFLGEKLSRKQWSAVAIATLGVALLAWEAREMLSISLALAVSFAAYGLFRRSATVAALPGLTIETGLLLLPAIGILAWQQHVHGHLALGSDIRIDLLLASSGLVTAVPLLLFAMAAKRMDYSALGFTQFLTPTMVFFLGLFVFGEPLRPVQLACFVLIWTAAAIFVWDLLARRQRARQEAA